MSDTNDREGHEQESAALVAPSTEAPREPGRLRAAAWRILRPAALVILGAAASAGLGRMFSKGPEPPDEAAAGVAQAQATVAPAFQPVQADEGAVAASPRSGTVEASARDREEGNVSDSGDSARTPGTAGAGGHAIVPSGANPAIDPAASAPTGATSGPPPGSSNPADGANTPRADSAASKAVSIPEISQRLSNLADLSRRFNEALIRAAGGK